MLVLTVGAQLHLQRHQVAVRPDVPWPGPDGPDYVS